MAKSFGHYLLDEAIPTGYRPEGTYTNKKLRTQMVNLAKDNPEQFVKTIGEVKRLGDSFATTEGISVGLDDVAPLYKERNAITHPALARIKKTADRAGKIKIIAETQDKLIEHAVTHPGTMGDMARAGARGNALQLMRTVGAPAASSDEHDNIQPWLTTHSYAEGLHPSEWWATNREARMSAVKSNIEVSEPGELSKILVNNTSDQIVTEPDCHTTNGLSFSTDDAALLDRFLARSAGKFSAGELLTQKVLVELRKQHIDHVIARSPMTCEAQAGVCQKCMGLTVVGKLNKIGDNVGIRSSQAIGEPLTQLALNAKHGVRVSGSNPLDLGGLEGFRAIIESPEAFKNKATLAPIDGKIHAIAKAPQGGHYITVGDEKMYVASGLNPTVKIGDKVFAGDIISTGTPRPNEVVALKGLGAGRDYMVSQLARIYKDSGIDADRRHFEVLAKSTLNSLKIEEVDDADSADHGLIRGDILDYNKYRNIVSDRASEKTVDHSAVGHYLGEAALHHLAGQQITEPMIDELKAAGFKKIKVSSKAPLVSPYMAPAARNPLLHPDWLVRLGHRFLEKTLLEGAHRGDVSHIHSTHPIPGLVMGAEFGEGENGKY